MSSRCQSLPHDLMEFLVPLVLGDTYGYKDSILFFHLLLSLSHSLGSLIPPLVLLILLITCNEISPIEASSPSADL